MSRRCRTGTQGSSEPYLLRGWHARPWWSAAESDDAGVNADALGRKSAGVAPLPTASTRVQQPGRLASLLTLAATSHTRGVFGIDATIFRVCLFYYIIWTTWGSATTVRSLWYKSTIGTYAGEAIGLHIPGKIYLINT